MGRNKEEERPVAATPPPDAFTFLDYSCDFTSEEIKLKNKINKICREDILPIAAEVWEEGKFNKKFISSCKKMGPAGLQIKGYGCAGLTNVEASLAIIEMARVDASFATFVLVHSGLCMKSIAASGTEEQKERWLPQMARWEKIGCFALTEAEHGSDAGGIKTKAKKTEKGFLLNGSKRWIGNATFCDLAVVWAREEETGKVEGFIVESSFPGFTATPISGKASLRGVENANITLKDCFVPNSNVLLSGGFSKNTKQVLQSSRALVAAACAGVLMGAYDAALHYCSRRIQFGRPLTGFQLVQERLMRALGLAHACCTLSIHLARRLDTGKSSMPLVALVKATSSRLAREGISVCREVMGGNGIELKRGVAKALADIEALYTYEGTYDINILIAGRAATGVNALT